MKDDDAKIYSDVRASLNTLRVDASKIRIRVASHKVFLSGELHKLGGMPMNRAKLLGNLKSGISKIRGVRMVVVESDLEAFVRRTGS